MAETTHSIGAFDGLRFDLRWPSNTGDKATAAVGFGNVKAWVGRHLVWGREEDGQIVGVDWYWDELLDHLAHAWKFLAYEEIFPLGLRPPAPQLLRSMVRDRWIGQPENIVSDEDNLIAGFEYVHDLAKALQGATLPSMFLIREGNFMLLATAHGVERTDFRTTIETLKQLGDEIALRLATSADERSASIISTWKGKTNISPSDVIEISSGLSSKSIRQIASTKNFEEFWQVANENFESNELLAAARMIRDELPDDVIRYVIDNVRGMPKATTRSLDKLSSIAQAKLKEQQSPLAYEQGYFLAQWFRQIEGIVEVDDTVDPEKLLKGWGVAVREISLNSQSLDALCCWGPKHGPGILLNINGRLARFPTGRRSSLAHEICHLLVDRNGSLPLAEALGGNVPKDPEKRANAFAAELLVPRDRARLVLDRSNSLDEALDSVSSRFHVSHEVAAWQILNADAQLPTQSKLYLLKFTYHYNKD